MSLSAKKWVISSVMVVALSGLSTQAFASWSVRGERTSAVVTDCSDCGTFLNLSITCRGNGEPAQFVVHSFVEGLNEAGRPVQVSFQIEEEAFLKQAITARDNQAQIASVFTIAKDDPLIQSLKAGQNVTIGIQGREVEISLAGSSNALSTFERRCGWTRGGFEANIFQESLDLMYGRRSQTASASQTPSASQAATQSASTSSATVADTQSLPVFSPAPDQPTLRIFSPLVDFNASTTGETEAEAPDAAADVEPSEDTTVSEATRELLSPDVEPIAEPEEPNRLALGITSNSVVPTPLEPDQNRAQGGIVPDASQTVVYPSPAYADADGLFWHTGNGSGYGSPRVLSYAVPGTRKMTFQASCEDFNISGTEVLVFNKEQVSPSDGPVTLTIAHGQGTSEFEGESFQQGQGVSGSRFIISSGDPLWLAMAESENITVETSQGTRKAFNGMNGQAAFEEFSYYCR